MALALDKSTGKSSAVFTNMLPQHLASVFANPVFVKISFRKYISTLKALTQPILSFKRISNFKSTFTDFISHIIQLATEKKMVYIHTSWIITRVAYKHTTGYFPFIYNPSISVSTYCSTPIPLSSVAVWVYSFIPQYAVFHIDIVYPKCHKVKIERVAISL